MTLVLDTNVFIEYVREGAKMQYLEEQFAPFASGNTTYVSIVTVAELYAFADHRRWGPVKWEKMYKLLSEVRAIEISSEEIIEAYRAVEAYSRNPSHDRHREGSSIIMGKNDIWIAATAKLLGARLLTSDSDFDHLHPDFIEVLKY